MGECVDEGGRLGNCPNKGIALLVIVAVTATLCLFITWATNRLVGALAERGWGVGWGIAGGFASGAVLVAVLFALLIALI